MLVFDDWFAPDLFIVAAFTKPEHCIALHRFLSLRLDIFNKTFPPTPVRARNELTDAYWIGHPPLSASLILHSFFSFHFYIEASELPSTTLFRLLLIDSTPLHQGNPNQHHE